MDLLQKFIAGEGRKEETPVREKEDLGGLELNLGLSLGGCFSGDRNKLARASSVIDLSVVQAGDSSSFFVNKLSRCSSLPKKSSWLEFSPEFGFSSPDRRECEGLTDCKRTEAKRQRLGGSFEGARTSAQTEEGETVGGTSGFSLDFSFRLRTFQGGETTGQRQDLSFAGHFPVTSKGSSSSGVSDPEAHASQGLSRNMEAKWPDKQHFVGGRSVVRADSVPAKMMGELPYVCTRGGGQNGKKIEGFLYKYDKGEEIRIVCACHGNFLSPAEFVKHGGGGDVEHPLRHIVVNPFPPFLRGWSYMHTLRWNLNPRTHRYSSNLTSCGKNLSFWFRLALVRRRYPFGHLLSCREPLEVLQCLNLLFSGNIITKCVVLM